MNGLLDEYEEKDPELTTSPNITDVALKLFPRLCKRLACKGWKRSDCAGSVGRGYCTMVTPSIGDSVLIRINTL